MKFQQVYNPKTGRYIRQGGPLHVKLCKAGILSPDGEDLTKKDKHDEKEKKESNTIHEKTYSNQRVIKYRVEKLK